jgi:hypothetical protein
MTIVVKKTAITKANEMNITTSGMGCTASAAVPKRSFNGTYASIGKDTQKRRER